MLVTCLYRKSGRTLNVNVESRLINQSINVFYHRHLVYIVYFRHLAILNYCLALGFPQNKLEFQIELKNTNHSSPMPKLTTSSSQFLRNDCTYDDV